MKLKEAIFFINAWFWIAVITVAFWGLVGYLILRAFGVV